MVVVVIISVVTTMSVLSMSGGDKSKLTAQENQLKAFLGLVRDQSAFNRRLYLVVPDKTGLKTYVLLKKKWETASKVDFLAWSSGVTVSWSVDETFAKNQQLPEAGWMFWPTGETLEGDITLSVGGDAFRAPEKENIVKVSWNDLLQFDALEASK